VGGSFSSKLRVEKSIEEFYVKNSEESREIQRLRGRCLRNNELNL